MTANVVSISKPASLTLRGSDKVVAAWILVQARGTGSAGTLGRIYVQFAGMKEQGKRPTKVEAAEIISTAASVLDEERMGWVRSMIADAQKDDFRGYETDLIRHDLGL
jgi:hypothetical protein